MLKAALDTLKECIIKFTELRCREQAIEGHYEQAHCLRLVDHDQVCAVVYLMLRKSGIASLSVLSVLLTYSDALSTETFELLR